MILTHDKLEIRVFYLILQIKYYFSGSEAATAQIYSVFGIDPKFFNWGGMRPFCPLKFPGQNP